MVDRDTFTRLYAKEKKSYAEIAIHFGCSASSVWGYVKKFGLVGTRRTIEDLAGRKFGNYSVIKYVRTGRYSNGGIYHIWECQCDCGSLVNVRSGNLKQGLSTKCRGCSAWNLGNRLRQLPIDYNVWFGMVERCKRKGIELSVTPEYLYGLFQQQRGRCALSGEAIYFGTTRKDETTASPDRIDAARGYVDGNIRWVHKYVNVMRNSKPTEEFIEWCKRIVNHQMAESLTTSSLPCKKSTAT